MEFDAKSGAISTLLALIIVCFIMLFNSCATIKTFDPKENAKMAAPYFIGTQYNAHKLMSDRGSLPAMIDIIPSFCADVLLLPGHVMLFYINDEQDISGPYKQLGPGTE